MNRASPCRRSRVGLRRTPSSVVRVSSSHLYGLLGSTVISRFIATTRPSDFSANFTQLSLPSVSVTLSPRIGRDLLRLGDDLSRHPALTTCRAARNTGYHVLRHTHPPALPHEASLSFRTPFRYPASSPHGLTAHAVAFDSWLPSEGPTRGFHPLADGAEERGMSARGGYGKWRRGRELCPLAPA